MVFLGIFVKSQSGYHPYEVVEQVAIVLKNISPDLNIWLDMKFKNLIIFMYVWLHIEN
jgi:hypothetical protein